MQQEPAKSKEGNERSPYEVMLEDLNKFKDGECPLGTEKNADWTFRNFESWHVARNRKYLNEQCPPNVYVLLRMKMCNWPCNVFLYLLLAGLRRCIRK